jgi:hypothetical protein
LAVSAYEYELEGAHEWEGEWESEWETPGGAQASRLSRLRRQALARILGLILHKLPMPAMPPPPPPPTAVRRQDPTGQREWEAEMNPLQRIYPDAMMEMEHLAHAAMEAESEAEAEAFIGALIPLAARLLPRVAPAVMRAAPQLIRGVSGAARVLRATPATRPLVRTLPSVVRHTVTSLARQATQGRPITPRATATTLARQTARVLGHPRYCAYTLRRSRALDRRYHLAPGAVPRGMAAPRQAVCPRCGR